MRCQMYMKDALAYRYYDSSYSGSVSGHQLQVVDDDDLDVVVYLQAARLRTELEDRERRRIVDEQRLNNLNTVKLFAFCNKICDFNQ